MAEIIYLVSHWCEAYIDSAWSSFDIAYDRIKEMRPIHQDEFIITRIIVNDKGEQRTKVVYNRDGETE